MKSHDTVERSQTVVSNGMLQTDDVLCEFAIPSSQEIHDTHDSDESSHEMRQTSAMQKQKAIYDFTQMMDRDSVNDPPTESEVERRPRTRIEAIVHSLQFELASGLTIIVYMLVMAAEFQHKGIKAIHSLKDGAPASTESHVVVLLDVIEAVFTLAFTVELLLRIVAMKRKALYSLWIWFDAVIVSMTALQNMRVSSVDPSMMRVLRLAR